MDQWDVFGFVEIKVLSSIWKTVCPGPRLSILTTFEVNLFNAAGFIAAAASSEEGSATVSSSTSIVVLVSSRFTLIQLPNYSAVKRLVTADELAVMRENVITRAISYRIYRCEMG